MSLILTPGAIREFVQTLDADQRRMLVAAVDMTALTAGNDDFFYETKDGETGRAGEARIDGLLAQIGIEDLEPAATFADDDVGLLMSVLENAAVHADDLGLTFTRADGERAEADGQTVRSLAAAIGCPLPGHAPAAAEERMTP